MSFSGIVQVPQIKLGGTRLVAAQAIIDVAPRCDARYLFAAGRRFRGIATMELEK